MNDWTVPEEATMRVRGAVMRRIRRRKQARKAVVGVACALLAAVLFWPRMPEAEVLALRPPAPPVAPLVSFTPKPRVVVPAVQPLLLAAGRAEKMTIFTDDPDVIIVLVSDGDGGGD